MTYLRAPYLRLDMTSPLIKMKGSLRMMLRASSSRSASPAERHAAEEMHRTCTREGHLELLM